MEKTADTIEAMEMPLIEEVVVMDEPPPVEDMVLVEEPVKEEEKAFDWDNNKDLKKFLSYLQGKVDKVPAHSGKTTAGCERAMAYLKTLDREISKAIADDLDCNIDDQEVEKLRKDIRKMIKKLDKRHKEISNAYDADDDKYAVAENTDLIKEANKSYCKKCGTEVSGKAEARKHVDSAHNGEDVSFTDYKPEEKKAEVCGCEVKKVAEEIIKRCQCENGGCEKLGSHKVGACSKNAGAAKAMYIGELCNECAELMPKEYLYPPFGTAKKDNKVYASTDNNCPTCGIKLWDTDMGVLECLACDQIYEKTIKKEATTPRVQLVMTPFERAITGIIVNSKVANGKNIEDTYAELKKVYKFSERDELSIQQLLIDLGYPAARNFVGMPHDKNIEMAVNYQA